MATISRPDPADYTDTPWTDQNGQRWLADAKGRWSIYVDPPEAGGGASAFADLTDKTTADLPTINTPLANALTGKLSADSAASTYAPISTTATLSGAQTFTGAKTFNAITQFSGTASFLGPVVTSGGVTFGAGTTITYGVGGAADHRIALELGALATVTPGTGVATSLALAANASGGVMTNNNATGAALALSTTPVAANEILGYTKKVRSSDSAPKTSSTSQTADTVLTSWTLKANTAYRVDFLIFISCGAGGFAGKFTVPSYSGSAGHSCGYQYGYNSVGLNMGANLVQLSARAASTTGAVAAGFFYVRSIGGGSMSLDWAQNASDASETKVLTGSSVIVTEM